MELVLLLLATLGVRTDDLLITDGCDLIELNEVYDTEFKAKRFDQLIFWEYRRGYSAESDEDQYRLWVADWRIVKDPRVIYSYSRKMWVVVFFDTTNKSWRVVSSTSFYHTKGNYDREVEARKRLPVARRHPALGVSP